jgi:hypothetical protein
MKVNILLQCVDSGTEHSVWVYLNNTQLFRQSGVSAGIYTVATNLDVSVNDILNFFCWGHLNQDSVQGRTLLIYETL